MPPNIMGPRCGWELGRTFAELLHKFRILNAKCAAKPPGKAILLPTK
ncbi:hypothetical protein USDA257_c26440 [Sinorhizobium fredii USDA 257]|uniref:Uncharacterized protein n=1 Tax=Sinorhizobium fredii (strain USDA 257) TaxID=1185652 RepID=I3X5R2_SINF2|nr:hypothetical protein USDA257_c26440 [Sinorhizobium fredii USDA 257]